MKSSSLILGCIADDFTGAGDIASFFTKGGLQTVLYNGIPGQTDIPEGTQAAVISLKTRTAPVKEAVRDTIKGVGWLRKCGCDRFYIKYCSTFDSTSTGNIGPVLDAVLEYLNERYTILCPSLPVNKRTVRNGVLYVDGIPLDKSSMRNHPLTPMWDSRICELMKQQSRYPCITLKRTEDYNSLEYPDGRFYLIPDYEDEEDARKIISAFGKLKVITGGSGLAYEYAEYLLKNRPESGDTAVLAAGSVSETTLSQIRIYKASGNPYYKIDVKKLWERELTADKIWEEIKFEIICQRKPVLIYCSECQEDVVKGQSYGKYEFAGLLENTLADVVKLAVAHGVTNIICAGGETSGAITRRLGYKCFYIGKSVAPGVPVMIPHGDEDVRVVLKSGNFGEDDFFLKTLEMMKLKETEYGEWTEDLF